MTYDPGVYRITCLKTGSYYIGSTGRNFRERFRVHFGQLRRGVHPNSRFQAEYNAHGKEAFVCEVVERVDGGEEALLKRERHYINKSWGDPKLINRKRLYQTRIQWRGG